MATNSILILIFCISYLQNQQYSCSHPIWPAILSKPGFPELSKTTTGFSLLSGELKTVSIPPEWSGILFSRTLCGTSSDSKLYFVTGDCGSATVECDGAGIPSPTATLVDLMIMNSNNGQYKMAYFVSLMGGYNLPMTLVPIRGSGRYCRATGCIWDLNKQCPEELKVSFGNESVGCNYDTKYSDYFERLGPISYTPIADTSSTFDSLSADYYEVTFNASSIPSTSPPIPSSTNENETQNHEVNKKPNLKNPVLQYLGRFTVAVITLVLCTCAIKLAIRRRFGNCDIELEMSVNGSGLARNIEEAISSG